MNRIKLEGVNYDGSIRLWRGPEVKRIGALWGRSTLKRSSGFWRSPLRTGLSRFGFVDARFLIIIVGRCGMRWLKIECLRFRASI